MAQNFLKRLFSKNPVEMEKPQEMSISVRTRKEPTLIENIKHEIWMERQLGTPEVPYELDRYSVSNVIANHYTASLSQEQKSAIFAELNIEEGELPYLKAQEKISQERDSYFYDNRIDAINQDIRSGQHDFSNDDALYENLQEEAIFLISNPIKRQSQHIDWNADPEREEERAINDWRKEVVIESFCSLRQEYPKRYEEMKKEYLPAGKLQESIIAVAESHLTSAESQTDKERKIASLKSAANLTNWVTEINSAEQERMQQIQPEIEQLYQKFRTIMKSNQELVSDQVLHKVSLQMRESRVIAHQEPEVVQLRSLTKELEMD